MTARGPDRLPAPPTRSRWHGERTRVIPRAPQHRAPPRPPPPQAIAALLRSRHWHTR